MTSLAADLTDALTNPDAAGITKPAKARGKAAAASAPSDAVASVQLLPLALLDDNPRNRAGDDLGDVSELVDSIKAVGLLEPLLVAPGPAGRYTIVAGHRRRRALERAGEAAALCTVRADLVDEQGIAARLVENLHREDLTPLQEAAGYQELADLGHSQRAIAKLVGKTQPHISKRLSLLELPEQVQTAVIDGTVTIEQARELRALPDEQLIATVERVRGRASWQSTDNIIESAKVALEREAVVAAAAAEIQAEGLRYLASYTYEQQLLGYPLADRISVKAHEKLDCHAVGVGGHGNSAVRVPLCTKPRSHPAKERKETAAEKKVRLERERLAEEQAKAKAAEQAARAQALAGKPSKAWDELIEGVALQVAMQNADELCQELGLLNEDDDRNPDDVLEAYAASSAAARRRVLLADALDTCAASWASPECRGAYEAFLIAHGWTKPEAS